MTSDYPYYLPYYPYYLPYYPYYLPYYPYYLPYYPYYLLHYPYYLLHNPRAPDLRQRALLLLWRPLAHAGVAGGALLFLGARRANPPTSAPAAMSW